MLSIRTAVARSTVIMQHTPPRRRRSRIIPAGESRVAGVVAQIIDLALIQQGIVFVSIAACGGCQAAAAGAEVILFLVEVVDGG